MNHVFLSGRAETGAVLVSKDQETPHAVMTLTVTHRTAAGQEKKERYPVSAWRATAQRLAESVRTGSRVTVTGYLSQRQTPEGIFLEVTADEFQASPPTAPRFFRPIMNQEHPETIPKAQENASAATPDAP